MRKPTAWAAAVGLMGLVGAAHAALVDRGGGMIYDTTRNITWLADMNYAFTSGYAAANAGGTVTDPGQIQASGRMGWDAAFNWASSLVFGGFDDWRLPTLNPTSDTTCSARDNGVGQDPPDYFGFGCTGGELSGLFVTDLGNQQTSVLNQVGDTDEQIANLALFSNVQNAVYWSGTEVGLRPTQAWLFDPRNGLQGRDLKSFGLYAVAVRDGDVTAVPEPQSLALALTALGATWVARRRRPR